MPPHGHKLPQNIQALRGIVSLRLPATRYERQTRMGQLPGQRLGKEFFFGLVVESPRDVDRIHIGEPYVMWAEVEDRLSHG